MVEIKFPFSESFSFFSLVTNSLSSRSNVSSSIYLPASLFLALPAENPSLIP